MRDGTAVMSASSDPAPEDTATAHPSQSTSAREIASRNPATGALLGHVPLVGPDGIDAAVRVAREAQPDWARAPLERRAAAMRRFAAVLVEDAEATAKLVSLEQGKPLAESMSIELMSVLPHIRWLVGEGVKILEGRSTPMQHPFFSSKQARFDFDPLGVIAIIAPGNYPFAIPVIQMLMALMAGNAVILKPSPHTPLVGQKIAELSRRANLPTGLLTVIHVADADAAHLTSHPGLNKIVFTGSVEVGRRVMASAAAVPTPVVLELGGKDAAIVAPDANIQRAARGIVWYSMANSGQTCAGVEQVFVHAGVYDRFVAEATALVESLRAGDGLSADVDVGPLQTHRQLELIEEHVEAAREQGARILTGGYRRTGSGLHYAPTVLAGVAPHMAIACEETFGPVLPITRVDSLEEAVQLVNASAYGLTASVWTENKALGLDLARRLRAGAVNINDHAFHFAEPGATWGGVGHSGFGRTTGLYGLMEMVAPKYISSDMGRAVAEAWWYPYDEHLLHFLRNAIRLLYGPLERRPWALLSLLLNPRTWQRVDLFRFARAIRKWL